MEALFDFFGTVLPILVSGIAIIGRQDTQFLN